MRCQAKKQNRKKEKETEKEVCLNPLLKLSKDVVRRATTDEKSTNRYRCAGEVPTQ